MTAKIILFPQRQPKPAPVSAKLEELAASTRTEDEARRRAELNAAIFQTLLTPWRPQ